MALVCNHTLCHRVYWDVLCAKAGAQLDAVIFMSDRMNKAPTCRYEYTVEFVFFFFFPKFLQMLEVCSLWMSQSVWKLEARAVVQTVLAGSLTPAQHLEPLPVSLFQTINCTSGLLLFGWPGDKVFGVLFFLFHFWHLLLAFASTETLLIAACS